MTTEEALASVRAGIRVGGPYSTHTKDGPPCPGFNHHWRTLYCNDEEDVVECRDCGRQEVVRCNFDEEYA